MDYFDGAACIIIGCLSGRKEERRMGGKFLRRRQHDHRHGGRRAGQNDLRRVHI